MSAFSNYLRTLGALFIPPKICPGLMVFNSISSMAICMYIRRCHGVIERIYSGLPIDDTIILKGQPGLCIFGSP